MDKLTFRIPLPRAWTPVADSPDAFVEVTLTPKQGVFTPTPIGGVLQGVSGIAPGTVQWRTDAERLEVSAKITLQQQAGSAKTAGDLGVAFGNKQPLEIDFAELTLENNGQSPAGTHVLLRGSVRVELTEAGALKDLLAPLWPIPDMTRITALRIEPSGLYLEGALPAAMFPPRQSAPDETEVVLRVPQQADDIDIAGGNKPFWTLEAFDFGSDLPTAGGFLAGYAAAIEGFRRDATFVDNVVAAPGAKTVVRIFRPSEGSLEWVAPELRNQFRVQLGGGAAGEAAFFPDEMTGKMKKAGAAWQRESFGADRGGAHHVLLRTRLQKELSGNDAAASMQLDLPGENGQAALVLTDVQLAALSLPGLPLDPALPPARRPRDVVKPRRYRSWLCTDRGWLAVDAAAPSVKSTRTGGGAIRGVLEIEKIMAYLSPPQAHNAAVAENEDALQVQFTTLDTTSVVLGVDFTGAGSGAVNGVHLFLSNPMTAVITPGVWYAAPGSGDSEQPAPAQLLPSLSALDDATLAGAVFQRATFVSPPPPEKPAPGAAQNEEKPPRSASVIVRYKSDGANPQFLLEVQADLLRLWHPLPNLPLAQSFSRTPDPYRDSFMDSNRGLIPFEPKNQPVILAFESLTNLPSVPEAPASWDDLGAWTIPASQFPTRYFLPTLPGLEATLPVKAKNRGEQPTNRRWGYRHAVPALDEAYAEVVEDPQDAAQVQTQGALDFTRVEGAETFEVKRRGEEVRATGWLLKSDNHQDGQVEHVKVVSFQPEGREPSLELTIPGFAPDPPADSNKIKFSRTDNVAGLSGTLNGERIERNGQTLAVKDTTTRDGDGRQVNAITLKDPKTVLKFLAADPEIIRWTGSYSLTDDQGDALTLDLLGVRIDPLEGDADPVEQRWMLHDGAGDWPSLGGWPLFPVKLVSLKEIEDDKLTAVVEAILLPRTPTPPVFALHKGMLDNDAVQSVTGTNLDGRIKLTTAGDTPQIFTLTSDRWPPHQPRVRVFGANGAVVPVKPLSSARSEDRRSLVCSIEPQAQSFTAGEYTLELNTDQPADAQDTPTFAGGRVMLQLTLQDGKITEPIILGAEGKTDWKFAPAPDKPVSLLRLTGKLEKLEELSLENEGSELTGLEIQHPLGVIKLGEGALRDQRFNRTKPNHDPGVLGNALMGTAEGNQLEYSLKLSRPDIGLPDPYWIDWCELTWFVKCDRETVVALGSSYQRELGAHRWRLNVFKTSRLLLSSSVELDLHTIDENRFLFKVRPGPAPDTPSERAWLKPEEVAGVIGVQFSPDRQRIESLTADLQVSLVDRYPNDAILLWDPEKPALHSMDQNVGAVVGEGRGLQQLGPATLKRTDNLGTSALVYTPERSGRGGIRFWRVEKANSLSREVAGNQVEALLAADQSRTLLVIGSNHQVATMTLGDDGLPVTTDLEQPGHPVMTAASAALFGGQRCAWSRATSAAESTLSAWQVSNPPQAPRTLSLQFAVTAMSFVTDTHLLLAGDNKVRELNLAADLLAPVVILENVPNVSALAAVDAEGKRLVTVDEDGGVWLRERAGANFREITSPFTRGAKARDVVALSTRQPQELTRFVIVYEGGALVQFEYDPRVEMKQIVLDAHIIATGDCQPGQIGALQSFNGDYALLVIAGHMAATRLITRLVLNKDGALTELTGRLTLQNSVDYLLHPSGENRLPRCTHRIDLYFDRAAAPAEAIFWSEHYADGDVYTAALAQHTFRFPGGQERVWQAPQMVRFTSLKRFAALVPNINTPLERPQDLVLDASAVFWLQPAAWAEEMRYGVGAAAIANDKFGLWLLPRELRSFETGLARAVRLPAATCWAFDNAPFEVRGAPALPAPQITIEKADPDPNLTYWSSGVQPSLVRPGRRDVDQPDRLDNQPAYFVRGEEAGWLDAGFLGRSLDDSTNGEGRGVRPAIAPAATPDAKLPKTLNDMLWLTELKLWLHLQVRHYEFELQERGQRDNLEAASLPGVLDSLVNNWRSGLLEIERVEKWNDRKAFVKWLKQQQNVAEVDRFLTWLSPQPDTIRETVHGDFVRGDSVFLASATLTHRHDPAQPAPLRGPALFEFPYRLRLEEHGAAPERIGLGRKIDVQLVVFDFGKGALKRLAHDRIAVPSPAATPEAAALAWARALMEDRKRFDAAYVLVDCSLVVPVPRRFEAAYEALPFAQDSPLGSDNAGLLDPRCRLPGLRRLRDTWQRNWLKAEPDLGLRLFAAKPAAPTDPRQKIVAATRFRLAPAAEKAEPLGHARVEKAVERERRLLALSQRDDVPFEVYGPQGYPRPDGHRRFGEAPQELTIAQPPEASPQLPTSDPAQSDGEGEPATLLPPLVDVVSWAARPGETTTSSWIANRYEIQLRGESQNGGNRPALQAAAIAARHPVSASLRRPRARAGAHEAVRLQRKTSAPLLSFPDRFVRADFSLLQKLDQTTLAELAEHGGVQIVVATRTDVFKSSAKLDKASSDPARLARLPDHVTATDVAVYLVATTGFINDIPAASDQTKRLVLHQFNLTGDDAWKENDGATTERFFSDNSPWKPLWPSDGNAFETGQSLSYTRVALPDGLIEGTLALIEYTKKPDGAVLWPLPTVKAVVAIKLLDPGRNFIPPKMSVSLLAGKEQVSLAGYGRLGPDDFSLIGPLTIGPFTAPEAVVWSRTAELHAIHRAPSPPGGYDVVVYGPGGELIPTTPSEEQV